MGNEITLDTLVLNYNGNYCKSEFESIFNVIRNQSIVRFGYSVQDSSEKAESVTTAGLKFAAIYLAMSEELGKNVALQDSDKKEFINLISAYVAARAITQTNRNQHNHTVAEQTCLPLKNPHYTLNFEQSDKAVVSTLLKDYREFITTGENQVDIKEEINFFFKQFSEEVRTELRDKRFKKHYDFLENLVINGPGFKINGISSQVVIEKNSYVHGDDHFKEEIGRIILTPSNQIDKSEIVGNVEALEKIEGAVNKLMAYLPQEKINPFLDGRKKRGFKQGFLLMGDTGTGKTLVGKFGMTLADNIARRSGKDFHIAKLNIESSYQEGGVLMLRNQLNEICNGERLYYLFIDEIDTVFSSRSDNSANSHYQRQKLGELMRFLDGEYPNRGNYLVVACVNQVEAVDRALKNARLERISCPGATTPEEKAKLLAIHFGQDLQNGKVQIADWKTVGEYACQAELDGRMLSDIVSRCYERAFNLHEGVYNQLWKSRSAKESQKILQQSTGVISENLVISEILLYGQKVVEEKKVSDKFNSKESGYSQVSNLRDVLG